MALSKPAAEPGPGCRRELPIVAAVTAGMRQAGEHAEQRVFVCPTSSGIELRWRLAMERIYPRCAGIDVHKDSLACRFVFRP